MTNSSSSKPDNSAWMKYGAYVYKRHMLGNVTCAQGKLTVDVCEPQAPIRCEDALKWIYDLLSALDSKASALMRLNGVMLAAAAFLLTMHTAPIPQSTLKIVKYDVLLVAGTAALSAVSILFCLYVVNVSWYFLGKVEETGGVLDYSDEFDNLQRKAKARQTSYMTAWWISGIAAALFVVEFVVLSLFLATGWKPW